MHTSSPHIGRLGYFSLWPVVRTAAKWSVMAQACNPSTVVPAGRLRGSSGVQCHLALKVRTTELLKKGSSKKNHGQECWLLFSEDLGLMPSTAHGGSHLSPTLFLGDLTSLSGFQRYRAWVWYTDLLNKTIPLPNKNRKKGAETMSSFLNCYFVVLFIFIFGNFCNTYAFS